MGSRSPQRLSMAQLRSMRSVLFVVVIAVSALALTASQVAWAQAPLIPNGSFEAGTTGWLTTAGASLTVDGSRGSADGSSAAHVVAVGSGTFRLLSQWWVSQPVSAGSEYRLEAWILDDDPGLQNAGLRLHFVDGDGNLLVETAASTIPGDHSAFRLAGIEATAPPGSVYARTVVEGVADSGGAMFSVDGVVLTQLSAPPEVIPTLQPAPPAALDPGPADPAPVATINPTSTRTPTPTATPTPTPRPLGFVLRNGLFDRGIENWTPRAGRVLVEVLPAGQPVVILAASGPATAWMEQLILVAPRGWYQASADLAPRQGVGAAWVRIAWYASPDGTGPQMSTTDSGIVGKGPGTAIQIEGVATAFEHVTTGSVQAPSGALSARVRILLQPDVEAGAELVIGSVTFAPSIPPAAPPPTASPSPTASPTMSPTASPTVPARVASTPASPPAPVASSPAASPSAEVLLDDELVEGQSWLRITEVMSDPTPTGTDWEYEWVEITNVGRGTADLRGMSIRDGQAGTMLAQDAGVQVVPGASLVVAGPRAEVDADIRLASAIGNGLGNQGDTVSLLDASGEVIDVVEYGAGVRLAAAPPGMSLHRWFDVDGHILGAASGSPTPGLHAPVLANEATVSPAEDQSTSAGGADAGSEPPGEASAAVSVGRSEDRLAWMLLFAVVSGAFGGVVAQRVMSSRQSGRRRSGGEDDAVAK